MQTAISKQSVWVSGQRGQQKWRPSELLRLCGTVAIWLSLSVALGTAGSVLATPAELKAQDGLLTTGQPKATLDWIKLQSSEQPQYLELAALVEAVSQSTVSAQTSGRIIELPFDVNDFVPQGAVVVRFTDTEQKARLKQAQATLSEAEVRLAELAQERTRVQGVYAKKLVAKAALDVAEANFNAAKARQAQATAAVQEATEQLEQTVVRAPYSGILQQRLVELGELATPGKPLLVGLSLEHLRLSSQLPQQQLAAVRQSRHARLQLSAGTTLELAQPALTIAPQAHSASHSFLLRLKLPVADYSVHQLYPGSWVRLQVQTGQRQVLLLPSAAVLWRGEVAMVWRKVANDSQPLLQAVRLRSHGAMYEVISGVKPGDLIAADALRLLQQQAAANPVLAQE